MNYIIFATLKVATIMALFGLFFFFLGIIDRKIFPDLSFSAEIGKGNQAVAILVAAIVLAFGLALGQILG